MKLLKPDHETLYQVPGVPGLVRKPVNIDGAAHGFTKLRSLRLYQFDAGSIIHGHAEDDEVFVIVTAGSVELQVGFTDEVPNGFGTFTLAAPGSSRNDDAFVAYLPPHSVYRMTPHTSADVFYARATPLEVRDPAIFRANASEPEDPAHVIFQDSTHAERLRLKLLQVAPKSVDTTLQPVDAKDGLCEALVHVQGQTASRIATLSDGIAPALDLASWDTVALSPGETPVLRVEEGSAVTVLAVLAC